MLPDWLVSVAVGIVLLVTALLMLRAHKAAWERQKQDGRIDEDDRHHYYMRYRRRMQTSSMLALIAILIPLGEFLFRANIPKKIVGYVFVFYWGGVLLMALWVAILGIGDFASTATHAKTSLAKIRARQRQLEEELSRYRPEDTNGQTQHTE